MNQRTITKLKLVFSGLSSRFQENQQLFKHLHFTFKSGRKSFQGNAKFSENKLIFHFKGSQEELSFD